MLPCQGYLPSLNLSELLCQLAVMSSEQSQEAICKAFHIGAADYLIKPIRKNEVATLWHHIWRKVMAAGVLLLLTGLLAFTDGRTGSIANCGTDVTRSVVV